MNDKFDFHNADLAGMQDAERRYNDGAMLPCQIEEQYRAIQARKPSQVISYVEQETPNSGQLSPEEIRMWKRIQIALPTASVTVGIGYVVMSGALNSMIAILIGCVAGGVLLSGLGSAMSGGGNQESKYSSDTHHHHYYQNNSFGGNANQQNT
jgi:hypothetical protein